MLEQCGKTNPAPCFKCPSDDVCPKKLGVGKDGTMRYSYLGDTYWTKEDAEEQKQEVINSNMFMFEDDSITKISPFFNQDCEKCVRNGGRCPCDVKACYETHASSKGSKGSSSRK